MLINKIKSRLFHAILPESYRSRLLQPTLMEKVGRFVACEMIEGDYMEFGTYQGSSFIDAYHKIKASYDNRIAQRVGGEEELEALRRREKLWSQMRFFAFDSFQGLPELTSEDRKSDDFKVGQYAFSQEQFLDRVVSRGVPKERVTCIPGWFAETSNSKTFDSHGIKKAAVVWIDSDLYSSTRDVLSGLLSILQDGTVIIFDDWFSYRGSPFCGEQRAFIEWKNSPGVASRFVFNEYHKEAWKRMSFIASERI